MEHFDAAAMRQEFARLNARLDTIEGKIDALLAESDASQDSEAAAAPAVPLVSVPEGVLHLLHAGQKQQAIEAYQQLGGVDEVTATAIVENLAKTQFKAELKPGGPAR
jgi:hypothetical protein